MKQENELIKNITVAVEYKVSTTTVWLGGDTDNKVYTVEAYIFGNLVARVSEIEECTSEKQAINLATKKIKSL